MPPGYAPAVERLPYILVLVAWGFISMGHLLPDLIGTRMRTHVRAVAWVAVSTHLATLIAGLFLSAWPTGFPEALSGMSLGVGIAYLWVARHQMRALGMLLAPLSLVVLGTSLVVPHRSVAALAETGYSAWLPIHLGLVFAGIAGFALSFVVGVLFLWARRRLKQKRFGGMSRLPSLEALDRIQFRAMLFGFVFLTLGIGAGGAWAAASLQETFVVDPKVWFTVLIWAWYGAALQVRLVAGRRGRWTALFSIVGFGGLIFSLVGLNFLLAGWHSYGS
ncbi:MAG: cytochrome c biogenesis protein CcsA [Myxococcales bacterium]|nr:cytochrome c biogenesis protein CcsA [Myxococcales bacterium]